MQESIEIRVLWPKGKNLEYPLEHELAPFIPKGASQVNYGQGEGQMRIGDSIWGVYWSAANVCRIQFEEGELTLTEFVAALEGIAGALEAYFGFSVEFRLTGMLNDRAPNERFL